MKQQEQIKKVSGETMHIAAVAILVFIGAGLYIIKLHGELATMRREAIAASEQATKLRRSYEEIKKEAADNAAALASSNCR